MSDVIFNNCVFHVTVSPDSIRVRGGSPGSRSAKDPNWISLPEASEKFKMSVNFIKAIARKIGCIDNAGASRSLIIDKELLSKHFADNPDEREDSTKRRDYVEKARAILVESGKKLHPPITIPKSGREDYMSNDEMAKKLGVSMSYFQFNVRPGLTEELKTDPDYSYAQEGRANRKQKYEDLIEEAINILDSEGKTFRVSAGRCSNKSDYLGVEALARKLDISPITFRKHIMPALEGKIETKAVRSVEDRVNNWREANVLQPVA